MGDFSWQWWLRSALVLERWSKLLRWPSSIRMKISKIARLCCVINSVPFGDSVVEEISSLWTPCGMYLQVFLSSGRADSRKLLPHGGQRPHRGHSYRRCYLMEVLGFVFWDRKGNINSPFILCSLRKICKIKKAKSFHEFHISVVIS